MLPDLAASAAVRLLNRQLERDPGAREPLRAHAGRTARFEVPPFSVLLGIDAEGRFCAATGTPDVTIAVDATAVPAAVFDPNALLRKVRLAGDADFAQTLSNALQRLRPEPEEELARFVGDAAAVRIVATLRAMAAAVVDGAGRLGRTAADYLVAENPMLVTRTEADAFARDVTELRDAVERLEKRLGLIEARRR